MKLAGRPFLLVALVAAAPFVSRPAAAADDAVERAAIASERAAAESRFTARDKACRERFVVSGCVEDARRERRAALDALRARQLVIDEVRRGERATARRTELAARAAEDARREQDRSRRTASSASAASSARVGKPLEARREGREASPRLPRGGPRAGADERRPVAKPASKRPDPGERQAREARSRAAYDTRQRQAAEHREQALAATVRRMQQHPPGKSLPAPGVGSALPARAPSPGPTHGASAPPKTP